MSRFLFSITFLFQISMLVAQTFVEIGNTYPVSVDGNKYVVNGFITFDKLTDEEIYANTLLWTVENVCPKLQEGINDQNDKGKSFRCDWIIGSLAGSGFENTYYCRVNFRVADQKLVYYISDVLIESPAFVMKKVTPLEKLTPDKKAAHKQTMEDFTQSESSVLNKLFDFISTNQLSEITHWDAISIRKPIKGMNEDECRLAFGKPQSILETNGEIQWMYSSSFYLFFKNGQVQTIIK